jgi:hypothetical protein
MMMMMIAARKAHHAGGIQAVAVGCHNLLYLLACALQYRHLERVLWSPSSRRGDGHVVLR